MERMRLKKQQQKARRKEKKAAKERAAEEAVHISEALRRLRVLWPGLMNRTVKKLSTSGGFGPIDDLTSEDWEQLGRDMANCDKLESVSFGIGIREELDNVDQNIPSLFRGWTRSKSIRVICVRYRELSVEGIRSMVPLLLNANHLRKLDLSNSNVQSEGFNLLFGALRNSPIKELNCASCGIKSMEIDAEHIPKQLHQLFLEMNDINAAGCRGIAQLLRKRDATLFALTLNNNNIDDDAVDILANSLQNNRSLALLSLTSNDISIEGRTVLLKLVSDICSINGTLQTNCFLHDICLFVGKVADDLEEVQECIRFACNLHSNRQKVIHTQLHSARRAQLCRLQGIERSNAAFYGAFDPLHLPEILALVGQTHGLGELHVALRSSIATLLSTVDRVTCLEQEIAYHEARAANLRAEVAAIKRAEGNVMEVVNDSRNKRRRI